MNTKHYYYENYVFCLNKCFVLSLVYTRIIYFMFFGVLTIRTSRLHRMNQMNH